jgi:GNAT superfamily N-acetyltransferase
MENKFTRAIPQLPVVNVTETAEFYRDIFGFKIEWTWENDYGAVSRDQALFYLSATRPPIAPVTCILNVPVVDPLYEEWRAKGAKIVSKLEDKPWNMREFTVEENNGHRFRVGQPSLASKHVARERVEVKLVRRIPTMEEYRRLTWAVEWQSFTDYAAAEKSLPQSLFCIVAEHGGKLAGMARVMGDGATYYYIMDMAVMPELQGRGIGTALMNAAVDFIRTQGNEKALTCLFTHGPRSGFYARFGFEGPDTWLYGMSTMHPSRTG